MPELDLQLDFVDLAAKLLDVSKQSVNELRYAPSQTPDGPDVMPAPPADPHA